MHLLPGALSIVAEGKGDVESRRLLETGFPFGRGAPADQRPQHSATHDRTNCKSGKVQEGTGHEREVSMQQYIWADEAELLCTEKLSGHRLI